MQNEQLLLCMKYPDVLLQLLQTAVYKQSTCTIIHPTMPCSCMLVFIPNNPSVLSLLLFNFLNVVVWFRLSGTPPLRLCFYLCFLSFSSKYSDHTWLSNYNEAMRKKTRGLSPLSLFLPSVLSSSFLSLSPTHFILSAVSQVDFAN